MFNGIFHIREPKNEPILSYDAGSPERAALKAELDRMLENPVEVPCMINGREIATGDLVEMRPPHNLSQSLGHYHRAGQKEAEMAIAAANQAKVTWSEMDWSSRATVLLKAAELLAGKYRQTLNAATMLSMSKTVSSGRDRLRLRADRLLALQPVFHDAGLRRPADLHPGGAQLHGAPPARGLRLRRHAVQLHVHRRQPAHRAGADGQRGGLEAGLVGGAAGVLHHEDPRRRRACRTA